MDTKPESLPDALVDPGSVVVAADRLEALSKAYDHGVGEIRNPGDNGHGGDGRIPIRFGGDVEADGGQTGDALPQQRGEAAVHDFPVEVAREPKIAETDFHNSRMVALIKQNQKTNQLADDGRPGGAADAQITSKN